LQTNLTTAIEELTKCETEVKRRTERKTELTKAITDLQQRLDEIKQHRTLPAPNGEKPVQALVRQTELDCREWLANKQLEASKAESQRIDARVKVAPLQRDLAKRQVSCLEKELAFWQKTLAERRKAESLRQAQEARFQLQNADPALKQLAERNTELAEKRRVMAATIEKVVNESGTLNKQLAQLQSDFERHGPARSATVHRSGNAGRAAQPAGTRRRIVAAHRRRFCRERNRRQAPAGNLR
jgi:DNA repair exonuclease SbcCD ATPase subunit